MTQATAVQMDQQEAGLPALLALLPPAARDIRLNLDTLLVSEGGAPDLSPQQIWGVALSSAYATRNQVVIRALEASAAGVLSEAEVAAAKVAATIMAMNNVYYRFTHLVHDEEIKKMPARLRMNAMTAHGIAKVDFELYSLAVSAINGCGMCMESHTHEVVKNGLTKTAVHSAVRIAAVVNAAAQALSL